MSPVTTQIDISPGMIDLGIGQPSPGLLPLDIIRSASRHRLGNEDPSYLAYGAEQGDGKFRSALAQFLSRTCHFPVEADHLFITAGVSMGLDLICTLFTRPGDIVFVEEPTYFLALRIFEDHGLSMIGIPMDEEGLIIEALEEQLSQNQPVFLYTIPTFHNPAGVTLSNVRRQCLAELGRRHNFLIIADEVYHLLSYTGEPPPPLTTFCEPDGILSLGSFSKILAPGLRLGWIHGRPKLLKRFTGCGLLDSGGGLNPFTSGIIRSALEQGLQDEHLRFLKAAYSQRMGALSSALRQNLPAPIDFTEPKGGYFVWLRFPKGIDTQELLSDARKQNVSYQPGIKFSCQKRLKNYLRLSWSYYGTGELIKGARSLSDVFRKNVSI